MHVKNEKIPGYVGTKLLSIIYLGFCPFKDILTKVIIGYGTKREDFNYYIDDFSLNKANNVH